jgi:actin-related protein
MAESNDHKNEVERLKQRLGELETKKKNTPLDTDKFETQTTVAEKGKTSDRKIDAAIDTSQKTVVTKEKEVGEDAEIAQGPVGLDIGTSNIVMAQNKGSKIHMVKQLNAFFTIPQSKFTKKILTQNDVMFFELEGQYYIIGYSAEDFANLFNANTRRSIVKGLLSPEENEGIKIIQAIISTLIQKPKKFGEVLCFSIPGEPLEGTTYVAGHETILKMYLEGLGFTPISINEGLAVVMSELVEDNFTGIGISMGGGMCNVCLSYLSVPVITFSIQKAGDYIDTYVGRDTGMSATKVKVIKEESLDLSVLPKNKVETALHMYYMDVILSLIHSIQRVISSSDRVPKIAEPIPIVLSGGTAMPKGCREKFETALQDIRLPVEISSIRTARDPLNTTAKGALVMAVTEE